MSHRNRSTSFVETWPFTATRFKCDVVPTAFDRRVRYALACRESLFKHPSTTEPFSQCKRQVLYFGRHDNLKITGYPQSLLPSDPHSVHHARILQSHQTLDQRIR